MTPTFKTSAPLFAFLIAAAIVYYYAGKLVLLINAGGEGGGMVKFPSDRSSPGLDYRVGRSPNHGR